MQIKNNNYSQNFGAIFKFTETSNSLSHIVEKALKESTIPAETQKIEKKFQIGGGSLYVYVPDENLQKLLDKLKYLKQEAYTEFITRVD